VIIGSYRIPIELKKGGIFGGSEERKREMARDLKEVEKNRCSFLEGAFKDDLDNKLVRCGKCWSDKMSGERGEGNFV